MWIATEAAMYGHAAGDGDAAKKRNGRAATPARKVTSVRSSSTSLLDFTMAFQVACARAAPRTARVTSSGMQVAWLRNGQGPGSLRRRPWRHRPTAARLPRRARAAGG